MTENNFRDSVSADAPEETFEDNDAVGYGRPPKHSRFRPGQSGNAKGRPKKSKNRRTIVETVANETHFVTEGDVRRRRSTLELVLLSLRNRSMEGNTKALRAVETLLEKYKIQEPIEPSVRIILPDNGRYDWNQKHDPEDC